MARLKRKRHEDFFTDLALLEASEFFSDCDTLTHQKQLEIAKQIRYLARRERNAQKALRIHRRLNRVLAFDPWEKTKHIKPDVFGDTHERIEAVKLLANRKLRISWVLWAMYHYWMFDVLAPGAKKYGKRYSLHRKLWFRHIEDLHERLKQQRWDRKRERVRARREKRKVGKKYAKRTAEETLAILKASKVQRAIDEMEPLSDLPKL